MDLRRFLDLYVSESQEHIRLLHRSLLALEEGDGAAAVDEAFRAAHTLKGLSAAMGYATVSERAHRLEDILDELRAGKIEVDAAIIDDLLVQADELETAISESALTAPGSLETQVAETGRSGAAAAAAAPDGTTHVAQVRLRPDAPIKSARAMLIMRGLADFPGVLGSDPSEFDDDFDGHFRVFLTAAADLAAVEASIARAGEVESVDFVGVAAAAAAPASVATPAAPVRQLRVDAGRLDGVAEGIGELSVLFGRTEPRLEALPPELRDSISRMGTVLSALQRDVLALRLAPVREAFERLPRVVRDAARTLEKEIELVIEGDDVELDRAILEEIGDPLVHLLRNAVDHGIELPAERVAAGKPARGRIRIDAERERSSVRITVRDDGRGVSAARVVQRAREKGLLAPDAPGEVSGEELFRLLSHPGLSTAEQVSEVSGRGVGMDAVVSRIRTLGGAIDMQTAPGRGTVFSIRLPITRALAQALRVRVGGEDYAIPLTHVAEAVELADVRGGSEREHVLLRDEEVPVVRLRRMLGVNADGTEGAAVIAEMGERRAALAVDALVGREQILVKSFQAVAGMLPYFSGATLLADGRPALVLDPLSVM